MTNTERKLDEARYFLGKMDLNDPYFDYNLSAFVNAARSVLWVMNHEFGKKEEYKIWYKSTEASAQEKILLKRVNDLRVQSTKQSGLKTDYLVFEYLAPDEASFPIIEKMWKDFEPGTEVQLTIYPEGAEVPEDEDMYYISGRVQMEKDESKPQREDLLSLCKSYFNVLEKWTQHCTMEFGK